MDFQGHGELLKTTKIRLLRILNHDLANFQENVSLSGKTPNHLKFRILERGNAVLKPGLKISFGLFISAEYKGPQNPDN